MTTLYLVRHGETEWNAGGRFQGQRDIPLNEAGRQQAARAAAALAEVPFTAIFTSDLARAAETARIVAAPHGLAPVPDLRLREASFGAWEGMTTPEIGRQWPDLLAAWQADTVHTVPPGGESMAAVQARMTAFTRELLVRYPDETLGLIGHGGALRAVVALALGADLTIFRRLRLDNCSVSIVTHLRDHFTLVRLNDVSHLRMPTAKDVGSG